MFSQRHQSSTSSKHSYFLNKNKYTSHLQSKHRGNTKTWDAFRKGSPQSGRGTESHQVLKFLTSSSARQSSEEDEGMYCAHNTGKVNITGCFHLIS